MSKTRVPWVWVYALTLMGVSLVVNRWAGVVVAAVLVGFAIWQVRSRAAARARIDEGIWRIRAIRDYSRLVPGKGLWTWLAGDCPTADLSVTPAGLVVTPTRSMRAYGYREQTLPWEGVVSIREENAGYQTPDQKLSFTPLTAFVLALVDEHVFDEGMRETEEEMREHVEGLTDGLGAPLEPGTETVLFTSDAPEGLADAIRRRARGAQRLGLTGRD